MTLGTYSIGVGDRFAHQAKAQLEACILAQKAGIEVIPVWNKSNREHTIIGSEPSSTRDAADAAVKARSCCKACNTIAPPMQNPVTAVFPCGACVTIQVWAASMSVF